MPFAQEINYPWFKMDVYVVCAPCAGREAGRVSRTAMLLIANLVRSAPTFSGGQSTWD